MRTFLEKISWLHYLLGEVVIVCACVMVSSQHAASTSAKTAFTAPCLLPCFILDCTNGILKIGPNNSILFPSSPCTTYYNFVQCLHIPTNLPQENSLAPSTAKQTFNNKLFHWITETRLSSSVGRADSNIFRKWSVPCCQHISQGPWWLQCQKFSWRC